MTGRRAIGLDVGGTKILGAVVGDDGTLHTSRTERTPEGDDPLLETMIEVLLDMRGRAGEDLPIGVGFPSMVTLDGVARYGPNIGLVEFPLRDALEKAVRGHVVVENDATAATWAEFVLGAGRQVRGHMIMFTLGTGVGGGVVAGGQVLRGAHGFAGDLGHLIVAIDGEPGPSGVRGEVEAYSSGTALGRLAREAHAAGRLAGTALDGPGEPSGQDLTRAALEGEEVALELVATAGRYLGVAAAGLVNCLDPELVVVGGGASAAGEALLGPARVAMREHLLGPDHRPEVPLVAAELGAEAGVIGAALLALER